VTGFSDALFELYGSSPHLTASIVPYVRCVEPCWVPASFPNSHRQEEEGKEFLLDKFA